jgi:hypothetical protein
MEYIWEGKRTDKLLIDNHFGLGDQIQYWRYVPEVFSRVTEEVWFRCDEELIPLFKHRYKRLVLVGKDEPLKKVVKWEGDYIEMCDLPLWGEECGEKYLSPNPHYFNQSEDVLKKFKQYRVGVCWCGNPANPRDYSRSCNPQHFKKLDKNGVSLFSLQKHVDPPFEFRDLRPFMEDLNQTAYLIKDLDLVITVDTSVAHLAGALGKEVWLLLADPRDTRWPQEGSTTPLYDSMRIFRRKDSWERLLEEVASKI